MKKRITPSVLKEMKKNKEKITMITVYDEYDEKLLEKAKVEIALVGDSYGVMRLGYPDTTYVKMTDMIKAIKSVKKSDKKSMIVGDLPYHTYETKIKAVKNAKRLMRAGSDAVKLEGGNEKCARIIKALVKEKIPVMGHVGNSFENTGAKKSSQKELLEFATKIEKSGAFSLLVKDIDAKTAERITKKITIPVIGINSGRKTDGQGINIDSVVKNTKKKRISQSLKQFYNKVKREK